MKNIDLKKLGERFKALRLNSKLNQGKFGEKIGMGQTAVSALEKGERLPTTEQLLATVRQFGKSADWLLYGIDPPITTDKAGNTADPSPDYGATGIYQKPIPDEIELLNILKNSQEIQTIVKALGGNKEAQQDVIVAVEGIIRLPINKRKKHVGRICEDLEELGEGE